MANEREWHHLYVNPVSGMLSSLKVIALSCKSLFKWAASFFSCTALIPVLLPLMRGKRPHYKSHHTAMLANVTTDNTAASSCCLSSKIVLTSDPSFPICGSVAQYFVNAGNLNWRGKQNNQAFSRTGTPVGQLLSPVWSCQRKEQQKLRESQEICLTRGFKVLLLVVPGQQWISQPV